MTDCFHYEAIAKMIDHTLLDPALTTSELEDGCALAARYDLASVCILPYYLMRCAELLAETTVHASTAIGFPDGGQRTAIKVAEARQALKDGGRELDVVINISKVRSGDWQYVNDELLALTQTIHAEGAQIKVIFQNACLDDASKMFLCEICGTIGVDWVETVSGHSPAEANLSEIELMRRYSPERVQVKAGTGIHNLDALLAARAMGASRVATTRTESILKECRRRLQRPYLAQTGAVKGNENSALPPGRVPFIVERQRIAGTLMTKERIRK